MPDDAECGEVVVAVFVPNPEREAVEELIEELSLYLAQRYRDAEDTLIREVAKQAARDSRLASLLPPTAPALAEARWRLAGTDWVAEVIFIDQAGIVTRLTRE